MAEVKGMAEVNTEEKVKWGISSYRGIFSHK